MVNKKAWEVCAKYRTMNVSISSISIDVDEVNVNEVMSLR